VTALFTRADYERLPEGFPAQLIEGMLVRDPSPSYGHQRIATEFFRRFLALVGPGRMPMPPMDVGLDEHNVFQPDVVVLRNIPPDHVHDVGIPLVAVEVFSPDSVSRDREIKRRRLIAAGVEEVWLVDPRARTVECHDPAEVRTARGDERLDSRAVPGFSIGPADLFLPRPR
jgi:Uma2 family endonuclease